MSPGLIRILTAADPTEVLTAMEALGIQLIDKPSFLEIARDIAFAFTGPVIAIIELAEQAQEVLQFFFENPGLRFPDGSDPTEAVEGILDRLRREGLQIERQREIFRQRLEEAAEEAAAGRPTAII